MSQLLNQTIKNGLILLLASQTVGCGNGEASYSLLSQGETFTQSAGQRDTKIDVLWVVDNSGSMASSQTNLTNNFPAFIQKFTEKSFDFKMAVTTTDAYLALPAWNSYYARIPTPSYYEGQSQANKAKFRDGVGTTRSGFFVLDPLTPNLNQNFVINAKQGILGSGDERPFQSFRTALDSSLNSGFLRADGFLAIIILTDEDDFSHDGTSFLDNMYSNPALHTVNSYVSYLDTLTNSTSTSRHYSVNSISVKDQACLNQINNGAQKINQRVVDLVGQTGGVSGNICGDFAAELALISKSIVELSTQFYLNGAPIPSSIQVSVNGQVVPNAETTNGAGGWTYNPTANSLVFTGAYIPAQGAAINVSFDPERLTF